MSGAMKGKRSNQPTSTSHSIRDYYSKKRSLPFVSEGSQEDSGKVQRLQSTHDDLSSQSSSLRGVFSQSQVSQDTKRIQRRKTKTFHDCIHGQITLPPLLLAVIDTPQFQRLRKLKQLGAAEFVFPSATHTRFEHSIGVAFKAGQILRAIRDDQPLLNIDDRDILCVQLAGLCHDLGHGPFSHKFETFLRRIEIEDQELLANLRSWKHEEQSVRMFRHLLEANSIDVGKEEYGGLDETDVSFVCEMIVGTPLAERRGREEGKTFLYDIVNNIESGLDVDKLDYLQRDKDRTLGSKVVTFERFTDSARVCKIHSAESSSRKAICFPEKQVCEAMEIFSERCLMHDKVYQNRRVLAIEEMIFDVLISGHDDVKIAVFDGDGCLLRHCTMCEAALDPQAFTFMDDGVIDLIRHSQKQSPGVQRARRLLDRVCRRDLYRYAGSICIEDGNEAHERLWKKDLNELAEELLEVSRTQSELEIIPDSDEEEEENPLSQVGGDAKSDEEVMCSQIAYLERCPAARNKRSTPPPPRPHMEGKPDDFSSSDLRIVKWHVHYGAKDKNPVDKIWFYPKSSCEHERWEAGEVEARKVSSTRYRQKLPRFFSARELKVFCTSRDARQRVVEAVNSWRERYETSE